MDEIRIWLCRPSDAEALAEIMTQPQVYHGNLQLPDTTPESWRKRIEANDPSYDYMLVAEVEGKVVGNVGLHRSRRPGTCTWPPSASRSTTPTRGGPSARPCWVP